jgi:chromosome segregation protein
MRIKRLDITGFKSFMDRTVVAFDSGVTGIVGPNGCGKSNVVDAIRWVLGEQSARQLRGRSMEDVIFNGSETRAPLSMAEVALTFDNASPADLPAQYREFAEITVGRRLFRTGESEYFINKTGCRLMDIVDLFLGSGVGRTAYSIIEQGRIGQIVSARPEDRRSIIEEAAGITKYKRRREAAERKMEATQQNLLRVADIVQELGKQLEGLNRQARRAEKYKTLKERIREMELHQATFRYLELNAARRSAGLRDTDLKGEEGGHATRLAELESAVEAERARQGSEERRLGELAATEHELSSGVKVSEVSVEASRRELEQLGRRSTQVREEITSIEGQLSALETERETLSRQGEELASLAGNDDARRAEIEESLREVTREQEALLLEANTVRVSEAQGLSRVTAANTQLSQIARRRADLDERLAKGGTELAELTARRGSLDQARAGILTRLGETRQLMLHLEEQRGAQEEALERTRSEFIQNEARLITLREELSDRRARLTSLLEVMRNYEGYGRGVRSVMTRARQGENTADPGVLGLVADVVNAPAEYESAVEAVLGQRLQYVIVESHSQGIEAIDHLKAASEGRSSFIPVTRLRQRTDGSGEIDSSSPGFVAPCLDVVRYDPSHEKVVRYLLGDAVIVRDLPAAMEIWQRNGNKKTLVTLDGEVLDPDGVVTGGTLEGEGHGVLQRRREVAELEELVRAFEAEHALAQERHRALQSRLAQLEGALKALARDGREKDEARVGQEKELTRLAEELSHVTARLEALEGEHAQLRQGLSGLEAETEEQRAVAATAEAEQTRAQERSREVARSLEELRRKTEGLGRELTAIKVKVAADAQRHQAVGEALERNGTLARELAERRERLTAEVADGERRSEELSGQVDGTLQDMDRLAGELAQIREQLARDRAVHEAASAGLREREMAIREVRKQLETVTQALSENTLTSREVSLELSHLEEQVHERCQAELKLEVARFHMMLPPSSEDLERLEELKAQAERMGPINLTAIEEYDALAERHRFMLGQKTDLESSMEDLKSAIVKIDRASRERFHETFDRVNEKFQQVFPRLFNGGRAGLVLTQNEGGGDAWSGGVEIFAQPPGKKLQSVNLLSGGEKALTAVAVIFAIFLIKPTPFCLLDEVDAPLDEANVGRYNEMVREMAKGSQFILITHNKRTMEMVDTLYGVTMEEPGVSKLVSVKLSDTARASAA